MLGGFAVAITLISGTVASTLFGLEAVRQRGRAESNAEDLKDAERLARGFALAAAAVNETSADSTRAVLLALEALELSDTVETRSALHQAFMQSHELMVLRPPAGITTAAASEDGSRFLTGSADGSVRMSSRSGELLWQHDLRAAATEGGNSVNVAFFLGEDRVVVAGGRGPMRLLDSYGNLLHERAAQQGRARRLDCLPFPNGREFLIREIGAAHLFALDGAARDRIRFVQSLPIRGDDVAELHPSAHLLATGSGAGPHRGKMFARSSTGAFYGAFSETGELLDEPARIASLSFSETALLIGTRSMAPGWIYDLASRTRKPIGDGGMYLTFIDGGRRIVESRLGAPFTIWDDSLEVVLHPQHRLGLITAGKVMPSDTGGRFAAGYQKGTVRIYGADGSLLGTLAGHASAPRFRGRFLSGGRELFTFLSDSARLWQVTDESRFLHLESGIVGKVVRYSPCGDRWLYHGRLLDARNRQIARHPHSGRGLAAPRFAFSPSGRHVAFLTPKLRVVASETGHVVAEHEGASSEAYGFISETEILFGSRDGSAVFDFRTGRVSKGPVRTNMSGLAPSPTEPRVVVETGRRLQLCERTDAGWRILARERSRDNGADAPAGRIEYSPDGERILVGGRRGRIRAFDSDLRGGYECFAGHRMRIKDIRYSRDGAFVATASADGTARLWRADGSLIAVLSGPRGEVHGCEFTPDGKHLLVGHGGTVHKWFVHTEDLVDAAKARLSRTELTEAEARQFAHLLGN